MAFALKPGKSISRELKRIARKQLGRTSQELIHDDSDEAVHEGRKSVKKVEAVLNLVDQVGFVPSRKDRQRLRSTRRALSALRDADVMLETFDKLRSRVTGRISEHTWAMIRAHLVRDQSKIADQARNEERIVRVANKLRKTRRSAKHWSFPRVERSDLPAILRHSYRASRKAMKKAEIRWRAADFHAWRKSVKSLWYQLRLIEPLASGLSAEINDFKKLETALGEEHNLTVLRSKLASDTRLRHVAAEIDKLSLKAAADQERRRRAVLGLGKRLHAASPKRFAKDLRRRMKPKGSGSGQSSPRPRAIA